MLDCTLVSLLVAQTSARLGCNPVIQTAKTKKIMEKDLKEDGGDRTVLFC